MKDHNKKNPGEPVLTWGTFADAIGTSGARVYFMDAEIWCLVYSFGLKPIGDTAIPTPVKDKTHTLAVEPETEKTHNFLAWLGATEEAVELLCDGPGSKGETFKRVIAGL